MTTYVNHRDTEDTEATQRFSWGSYPNNLCAFSVFSVSLWLAYVIT